MIEQLYNFLPPSLEKDLRETLQSDDFPWYFNDSIAYPNPNSITAFQFTHSFFLHGKGWESSWSAMPQALIYVAQAKLNFQLKEITRIKANLQPLAYWDSSPVNVHKDSLLPNSMSLLYYVDDSDGDTLIFDDTKENVIQRITPKRNSAIFFDSNIWHSSSPPKEHKRRIVINAVLQLISEE
jgi:hypothetical protein